MLLLFFFYFFLNPSPVKLQFALKVFIKYLSVTSFFHYTQTPMPADPGKYFARAPPFASTPRGRVMATTTVVTDGTRATVVS